MRRLALIALLSAVVVLGAAGFFLATRADAELRTEKPEARLPGVSLVAAAEEAPVTNKAPEAKQTNSESVTYDRWTVNCRTEIGEGSKKCSATNRIVDQKTGKSLFVWVIGKDSQNNLVSYFQTPTGVLIGDGLTLIFDGDESYRIAFRSCDNRRCEATTQMPGTLIEKIIELDKLSVKIVSTTGYNLVFNVENSGIRDVFRVL